MSTPEEDLGNIIGTALVNYIDQAIQVYIGTLLANQSPPVPPAPPAPPPSPAPAPAPAVELSIFVSQTADHTLQNVGMITIAPSSTVARCHAGSET